MNKLLIISGPTATGKTALALTLAKKFNGELISADSRQIYRGMDIGTGKDIIGFQRHTSNLQHQDQPLVFYQNQSGIKLWGYDLVDPSQDFSVANFLDFAQIILPDIWSRGALPIIIGGTGFYIDALLNPPTSVTIKPDPKLRTQLSTFSVKQLQQKLKTLSPHKFVSMNHSDQNNPRRLIRAIEILISQPSGSVSISPSNINHLWINLTAPREFIDRQIETRVHKRLDQGFEQEIKRLLDSGFNSTYPAATATGYQQWLNFLLGTVTKQEALNQWIIAERQYARRQLTWFKKAPADHTFDVSKSNWQTQVALLVEDWYSKTK